MKKIILLLFLLPASNLLYGQALMDKPKEGTIFHASLLGAIKYPGLKVGADYLLINKLITKEKNNGSFKRITKNRYVTSNLGFYYHKSYNTNIFLLFGYLLQRQNSKGWYRAFEPQIGVSRTFIDAPVYKIDDKGTVKKQKAAGNFYLAPALAVSIGKDFSATHPDRPFSLFAKATLFLNYPYNNFIYGRGIIEAGAAYTFSQVMPHAVKVKQRKK